MLTHLQLQHHLHLVTTQWTDVVQDQSCDDVDTVGLVGHDTRLDHTHIFTQLMTSQPASMTKRCLHPSCFSELCLPGSPDRGPDSILWVSPGSGWWGGRLIRWCKGPEARGLQWCFHTWCPGTEESHTPGCSWSYCSGTVESSGKKGFISLILPHTMLCVSSLTLWPSPKQSFWFGQVWRSWLLSGN